MPTAARSSDYFPVRQTATTDARTDDEPGDDGAPATGDPDGHLIEVGQAMRA